MIISGYAITYSENGRLSRIGSFSSAEEAQNRARAILTETSGVRSIVIRFGGGTALTGGEPVAVYDGARWIAVPKDFVHPEWIETVSPELFDLLLEDPKRELDREQFLELANKGAIVNKVRTNQPQWEGSVFRLGPTGRNALTIALALGMVGPESVAHYGNCGDRCTCVAPA
ncbi:hypothetical protein [Mycetocola saprophilus]|uniref:hypothetical protein n=1 Tax=Mycetocola saprophilus TaxID=76636 RepID=UPI0012DD624E|nr:hypothetical protein [Mycetocola saprophilus]